VIVIHQGIVIAQSRTISGLVKDNNGDPLLGATIQVKNSSIATQAGTDGSFSLNVNTASVTLNISMTGYATQTVSAVAGKSVTVVLQQNLKDLEEVMVVAYGKQKKANVIGSVSQISGNQLKQAPVMNVTNSLSGRLPGLTTLQQSGRPGADDAALRIRGIGTTGGNQAPVIIVDGVQRPSFSNLDPNEIESITLLKDAVSTAVYGLQAANGVILVTTKRGTGKKASISYDGSVMIGTNTRLPKFMNGPDYMEWYNKATKMDNEYLMHINADPISFIYTKDQIDALRNGTNSNPLLGNTDWLGELAGKESISQHHNISVRGGSDNVKYFTNLGYLDQDGVVKNTGFKRYNVRTNLDIELNKVLSVALDLGVRQQNTNTPGISPDNTAYLNPFYQAVRMLPNLPLYAPNGLPTAYNSNAGWVNPLASVDQSGFQKYQSNVFQSNITFNIHVPWVKGLDLKLLAAYDKTTNENKSWLTPYTLMGRNRDQVSGDFVELSTLPGITRNTLRQSFSQNNRKVFQPSINYTGKFNDHSITGLLLYEWSRYNNNLFSTGASNFILTELKDINFGSTAQNDLILPTGSSGVDSRAGYVGRINYGYKDRYLLEVATRYDASVNFAPENRWQIFPAAALGWIVSKESFFDNLSKTVSYLKLKGSIGKLGNESTDNFQYLKTFSLTADPVVVIGGKPVAALYTNAPPNPDITWETSTLTNVGFESIFWNGKLGVDFEWFYKVTDDILQGQGGLFPPSLGGYYPATVNSGIVDNRGFDLQLRHRNQVGKFQYSVTGNFNWARNKIIRLDENPNLPFWQRRTGRSIGGKMGFVVDGIYQNWEEAANATSPSSGVVAPGFFKYKDLNGDGRLTRTDDMTFVGRSNLPEIMYGLNLDLSYKGFDFSALFQGAALCDVSLAGTYEGSSGTYGIDDNTPFTKTFYGYGNSPYYLVEGSWTPENPNAKYPRLTSNRAPLSSHNAHANSGWIVDGSYLRLKSMQLGYTIPSRLLRTARIQQCRFYVSGYNLFTWDKLKYLDPEMPNVNNGFYPQQRIFSGGINLTF
jgi:TonB-linked SusC/RagA family outer membrane protein